MKKLMYLFLAVGFFAITACGGASNEAATQSADEEVVAACCCGNSDCMGECHAATEDTSANEEADPTTGEEGSHEGHSHE